MDPVAIIAKPTVEVTEKPEILELEEHVQSCNKGFIILLLRNFF